MTVPLKIKSQPTRQYPQSGDEDYSAEATAWAQDVTSTLNGVGYQYTWVLGSAAEVVSGEATHSDWVTLLAAASDGDSIWVKRGTYYLASLLNINKRLTIQNEGSDCIHSATAAIVAGGIFQFSSAGTTWIGGTISQGAGTPEYAFNLNADKVEVTTTLTGTFSVSNIQVLAGLATFTGMIRDSISAVVYGAPAGTVNEFLSNLNANTTVNSSLTPNVDNDIDLGLPAKKWKDIQAYTATIGTISPTNIKGGTIGVTTPVTEVNVDNIKIDGDSIVDATNTLVISATGITKDVSITSTKEVNLTPTTTANIVVGGTNCEIDHKTVIQDYTVVGSVGSALQQFAGRDYTLAELEAYFTAAKVISFYPFLSADLGNDEKAAYDYTLGAAAKAPSAGTGIMGTAGTAISFDGGDYATNATKFDDMGGVAGVTGTFGGYNNSLARQAIINGNFDVWQRGTSFTNPLSNTYNLDRVSYYGTADGGTDPTIVVSQQPLTSGEITKSFYFLRMNVNGAGSSYGVNSTHHIRTFIENGTRFLAGLGKKVTISFYARSSIANKKIFIHLNQQYGTG